MIQDLNDAAAISDEMAELLLRAMNDRAEDKHTRITTSDKAFTLLKQATDEIRVCEQFVFRHDKDRLKSYL